MATYTKRVKNECNHGWFARMLSQLMVSLLGWFYAWTQVIILKGKTGDWSNVLLREAKLMT